MVPLVGHFAGIPQPFDERFDDTFLDELIQLAATMGANKLNSAAEEMKSLDALKRMRMMGRDALNKWKVEFGAVSDEEATPSEQPAPQHKPRHDVESVFWVLVGCLVRALPDDAEDKPTETSDCIFNDMLYQEIPSSASNRRDEALTWSRKKWAEALHPKLQMLAPMIVRMCELLRIDWRVRSTASNRLLLHQGFKRLLFMQIREIGKDIRLNTKRPRTIYARKPDEIRKTTVDSSHRASGCNSSQTHESQRPKRGSDSIADPGEATSSRKKLKLDHPPQVPQSTPPGSLTDQLFDGPLSPLTPEDDASNEETGPPLALEDCDERSQDDVEKKAMERVAEELKETTAQHKRKAESLVKMHLDDEAWHQVTVNVFNYS
jgi:hypothetical protein